MLHIEWSFRYLYSFNIQSSIRCLFRNLIYIEYIFTLDPMIHSLTLSRWRPEKNCALTIRTKKRCVEKKEELNDYEMKRDREKMENRNKKETEWSRYSWWVSNQMWRPIIDRNIVIRIICVSCQRKSYSR